MFMHECPANNVRVMDQVSDRQYKNIHLVDDRSETQVTIKDNYRFYVVTVQRKR